MIYHIVMWNFKPEVEEDKKEAIKAEMEVQLKGLVGKVPGLLTVDFVSNPITSSTHEIALFTTLEKAEDIFTLEPEDIMTVKYRGRFISSKQAKTVFEEIMKGKDPKVVVEEKGMKQVSDPSAILALVNQVLDANPQAIEDFKNGKSRAVGALVGQIMKLSKGQANPKLTNQILNEELKKR